MIRYALLCRHDHAFEAWFRDSETYDRQRAEGHVACPACGDADIRKAVMAPAVRRSSGRPVALPDPAPAPPAEKEPSPAPLAEGDNAARMRAALRELHARIKRDATDVGPAFPDEARAIHDGVSPPRPIYGTATDAEVRSLIDDGVGILPIPILPDERN